MTVGDILKTARKVRGTSQLDLALALGISQRHVSFVERGRSRPSRDLILNWMEEVGATVSARNAALIGAGFATGGRGLVLPERPSPAHHQVLSAHDPLPGLIFDADWRMVQMNAGATWIFHHLMAGFLASPEGQVPCWDMIAGVAHAGGLLSRMVDPWIYGGHLLRQLRFEEMTRPSLAPRVAALEQVLRARFGDQMMIEPGQFEPGLDLHFDTAYGRLSFFSVQSMFQLPQDTVPTSVRVGLWFPASAAARTVLEENVPAGSHARPTSAPTGPRRRSA